MNIIKGIVHLVDGSCLSCCSLALCPFAVPWSVTILCRVVISSRPVDAGRRSVSVQEANANVVQDCAAATVVWKAVVVRTGW